MKAIQCDRCGIFASTKPGVVVAGWTAFTNVADKNIAEAEHPGYETLFCPKCSEDFKLFMIPPKAVPVQKVA